MSLADCLKSAQENAPQNVQAVLERARALAARQESAAQRKPHVSFVGNLVSSDEPLSQLPDDNRLGVRLEQTVYPLTRPSLYHKQREAEYQASVLGAAETAADVGLSVKQAYFSVLKDLDGLACLRKVEEELLRLKEIILPKFTVGRETSFDLVKIKAALTDLQRNRESIELQLSSDQDGLAQLMGLDHLPSLKPLSQVPDIPPGLDPADNPTLRAIAQERKVAEWNLKSAENVRRPTLDLSAETGVSGQTAGDMSSGWDLGAAFRMSLYDFGEITAKSAQEQARIFQAERKMDVESKRIRRGLSRAQASAKAHRRDLERVRVLLPEARRAAAAAVQRYRRSVIGVVEVSDAMSLWMESLLNERSAYYAYLADLAQLERLVGADAVTYE